MKALIEKAKAKEPAALTDSQKALIEKARAKAGAESGTTGQATLTDGQKALIN